MDVPMGPLEKTNSGKDKSFLFIDAEHVPDVSDEALEICGSESSVAASQLTTAQQNCCR